MAFRPIGSEWGRWDLHFHTPSSYDYQNGSISNEKIVEGLKAAGIVAVAVTDHHFIDADRIKVLQKLAGGGLTIFPGIELRSELGGKESVHLIGIFPETADADFIWSKIQGPLEITPVEVTARGHDFVYVKFEEAAEIIHELGGVVSAHVGRKSNSLENIGNEHPYKRAFKTDLAKHHIDLFEIGRVEDAKDYREIVFPAIGFELPLVICSDNHDTSNYAVKASCWIKGDPAFEAFQQVISDPRERVYIGDLPPSVDRVRKNSTKYFRSISFSKISGSPLDEDWFAGTIPLNPGLIAIIGNKGMGKTALAESIGLLGSAAQEDAFNFLHPTKFRQPKNNKASQFVATLEWCDGHTVAKKLSESIASDAAQSVCYIPQHYLETICNEIQSANSTFEKELKSVIFSHVDDAARLGTESLDRLLEYLTEQTYSRMDQIRSALRDSNRRILELQQLSSAEAKQTLRGLFSEKMRELEAHDKAKPVEVPKPEADPTKQGELQVVAEVIEEQRQRIVGLTAELQKKELQNRSAQLRKAVADRVLGRLRNFQLEYERFIAEAAADCAELGLKIEDLVKVQIDTATPTSIRDGAQLAAETATTEKTAVDSSLSDARQKVAELALQLDAPNVQYQTYLRELEEWTNRRALIFGDEEQAGSINYLQAQMSALANIPDELRSVSHNREAKLRELYRELQQLVLTYKSLYSPVRLFIERHQLASGKFNFEFEASVACIGLEDQLFQHISQARIGSFAGIDEGRKLLKNLVETSDLNSEDGAITFVNKLLEYLTHDRRISPSPEIPIAEQLKKGSSELDVLNALFSLEWLRPRYSLKWSGKDIEQLSPGERGSLLLIFYLLIDRRDMPLIIDQPEENLDNQTVFELLVPCIKEARKKRQVVIVTHNPNLAVVCDADQVIHCSIDKLAKNKVTYRSGALENPSLNQYTVDVLEGTRPAFDQRDSKYQE